MKQFCKIAVLAGVTVILVALVCAATVGDTDIGTVTLINGDCDGDNEITSTDLSVVLWSMDTRLGDPLWDPTADLDGDNEITSTDLSILNMDRMGD